jgi:hypothetical protein
MSWVFTVLGAVFLLAAIKGLFTALSIPLGAMSRTGRNVSATLSSKGGKLIILLGFFGFLCAYFTHPPITYKVWESADWQTEVIESDDIDGVLVGISQKYRNQYGAANYFGQTAKLLAQEAENLPRNQKGDLCSSSTSASKDLVLQVCLRDNVARFEVTYPKLPRLAKVEQAKP